jgi:hypothetical protein
MPDYSGAVAAIKARLASQWVDGSGNPKTLIVYVNKQPEPPFPPIDPVTGNPAPFLVCEVIGTKSDVHTFGNAGNRFFLYDGLIILHMIVPIDEGTDRAEQLVGAAAEIFRSSTFYQDANGSYVRTIAPNPSDGGLGRKLMYLEGVQAGADFGVTVTIPFQYFHRA